MPNDHRFTYRRAYCTVCGRHRSEVEYISKRGLCRDCGTSNHVRAAYEQTYREGELYEHWRRKMAESVGAELPTS